MGSSPRVATGIELDNTVQSKYNYFVKNCSICKQNKSLDEFPWRNKAAGKKHSYCKPCRRVYDNAIWKNGDKKKTKKESRQALRKKREEFVISKLLSGCVDCGIKDVRVLEFDHLRDKVMNVTQMLCDGYSIDSISKEIEKCEVVCGNCHKIRTQLRANGWRLKHFNADMV